MPALSTHTGSATLLAFPGATGSAANAITAAFKTHRLPELLAAQLLRAAGGADDPEASLARALAARMQLEPLDLARSRGVLLIGAAGAGKSVAAAAIAAAAPRPTLLLNAREGLARLRAGTLPRETLAVMEAEGFHPLNPKARGAFAALNDAEGLEAVGVVSALGDAEDVAEIIAGLRFKRIIVTGLDRTRRLGALVAAVTSVRLAHVVREGRLETLSPAGLAGALMASS